MARSAIKLNKQKYFFHACILAISLLALWFSNKDIAFVFFFFAILLLVLVDLVFDLLGYGAGAKRVPVLKKIFGYIIGTILFGFFIAVALKFFDYIF